MVDKIGALKNLEKLLILDMKKKDKDISFKPFENLKIKELNLWGSNDGEFEKDILDKFDTVEKLKLYSTNLDQNDINIIGSYKNLKILDMDEIQFEKKIDYSPLKNLKEFILNGYFNIDINFFKSLKNIKKMTFTFIPINFDQSYLEVISNLSTLEELYFPNPDILTYDFTVLYKLKNLKVYEVIVNLCALDMLKFKSLKELNFRSLELTQKLIDIVGESTGLKTLYITYPKDNSSLDFTPLKKIKTLSTLIFNGENDKNDHHKSLTKHTLKGFDYIKKLSVERFDFVQSDIDDIASLPNLKELEFDFCYLEGNIDALKNNKNLKIINLDELHITEKTTVTTKPSLPTSTNGKCGEIDGKCPNGECCSKYGYCGTSDKHCKSGCQSEFGECKVVSTTTTIVTTKTTTKPTTKSSLPTSTNGKCGPSDGKCPADKCCSKYGYCGKTDDHCGKGCQSEFGECKNTTTTTKTKTKTKKATTTTKKNTTSKTTIPISTNGKCGKTDGKCPSGKCCSKYGWCGTSDSHCGSGCQSEFGKCN